MPIASLLPLHLQLSLVRLPLSVHPLRSPSDYYSIMPQQTRNFSQDMPPPGGFGNVKIDYRPQKKGFSNITFLAITTAVIAFGLGRYVYYQKKREVSISGSHAAVTQCAM